MAVRLTALEKSSDSKLAALTKRVEEAESRAVANADWTRRLDSLARRLDSKEDELAKRVGVLEERNGASEIADSDALERLNRTFEAFSAQLERLTERIDLLERRLDEKTGFDDLVLEDVEFDEGIVKFNAREPEEERDGGERPGGADKKRNEEISSEKARRLDAGRYLVGDDLPAGKYRVEIWRNWASIEVEWGENYQCCVLETNDADVIDGYDSVGVVELPEGAVVTLDAAVDFTYLEKLPESVA